jgi:putative membrane protein
MAFLTDADRARIEAAIAAAERRTTAEFVTVIARASDGYRYIPTLIAACATFVLSGLALLLPLDFGHTAFYAGQVATFIALAVLFQWPPLKMRLIPQHVQAQRARLLAHEQFLDLGLSATRARTGVMLFVSVAEHYVEIVADAGIQRHVDDQFWQATVADFVTAVRAGRVADGFVTAIEACTGVMAAHHPWTPDDANELPNRLVEL